MNEYNIQLSAAFNAVTLVNATEIHTDEESAMIAEYEGQRMIVAPDNYKMLLTYLRRDYAMPPFGRVNKEGALHLTICGATHIWVQGDGDGQGATLIMDNGEKSFTMHVNGGDLWQKILDISTKGSYKSTNLPL